MIRYETATDKYVNVLLDTFRKLTPSSSAVYSKLIIREEEKYIGVCIGDCHLQVGWPKRLIRNRFILDFAF